MTDQTELVLYHISPSRSSIVVWMLEELGKPYELRVLRDDQNRQPAFLALNPMGKVPTLLHKGVVITETAALCCYLAEAFPEAGLGVPIGDPRRGAYLKWLFFSPATLEPALMDRMLERPAPPRNMASYGDFEMLSAVLAAALTPGPFLLGEQFTAADVLIGSCLRWGRKLGAFADHPAFAAYVERLERRPACQRASEKDVALATSPAG